MTVFRPASWMLALVLVMGLASGRYGVAAAATKTHPAAADHPATPDKAKAKPTPAQQLFQTGAAAYAHQQMLAAADAFQKVVVLDPANADAYYYLGLSYYGLGQHDLAVAAFTEAQTHYPQPKGEVLFGLGLAHYALGQLDDARRDYAAVAQTTAADELKANAATWLHVLDAVLAQRTVEQALAQDATFHTGSQRYQQGRYLEAFESFETVLRQYPSSATLHYYLGACQYQLNRFDDAITSFRSVITIDPGSQQAQDAQLFIDSIRGRQQSRAGRPFSFFASLGSGYDSNVSYGASSHALPDATSQLQLSAAYRLSPNLRAQYGFWAGANLGADSATVQGLTSRDFNMFGNTGTMSWDWPVSRLLAVAGDYQFSWYFLANQSFLLDHRVTPRVQLVWDPAWSSSVYGVIEAAQYPTVSDRNSINLGLGATTVYQPPSIPSLTFTGGYDLLNVAAADDALSEQTGALSDGTQYVIRSRLAYSYLSHGPYLAADWHLGQTSLRLTSRFSWLNFAKPDIYQLSYYQGSTALSPSLNTDKLRADQLLQLSLDVTQPIWADLSLLIQASYWLNASNITDADYSDRSYSKGLLMANLTYAF